MYTAFARDVARGVDRQWVRGLYGFAVKPTVAFYFRVGLDEAVRRLRAGRAEFKFYEAGADVDHLPQLDGGLFLTDARLETELVFHDGLDLPLFAAFDVLKDEAGTERLRRYYRQFAALARERGVGLVLESPTWRASPRWAREIGYSDAQLDELNRKAIALMEEVREEYESPDTPFVISGRALDRDGGFDPRAGLVDAGDALGQPWIVRIGTQQIGVFAHAPNVGDQGRSTKAVPAPPSFRGAGAAREPGIHLSRRTAYWIPGSRPKSAVADFGNMSCRSRASPRSVARPGMTREPSGMTPT